LRERIDDIPALVSHFLVKFQREHGSVARSVSTEALALLRGADWPGNVRELANIMERACLIAKGETIGVQDLTLPQRRSKQPTATVGITLEEMERQLILGTLESTGWNRTHAARILGVTARTLSNKLKVWRARGLVKAEM
jgi:DNA-binding NtrC family response regulator